MPEKSSRLSPSILLDERLRFSLVELCETCRISADYVYEVVEEGLIEPEGAEPAQWRFDAVAIRRVQMAVRLQRDLRVNLPGAALALDLLDELETLRQRLGQEPGSGP